MHRQPLGLRHRIGRVLRPLQGRADRNVVTALGLAPAVERRRHLGLRGCPRPPPSQCCGQHRSHDKSREGEREWGRSLTSRQLSTSAWSATTAPRFKEHRRWRFRRPVAQRQKVKGCNPTMLSAEELERYARHIVLREVGGPGQAALKEASVLVIGAGGLGAPALMYLAAAGVGTLGVVDDDIVSLSNLQRQIIHATPDIGRRKVDSAAEQITRSIPMSASRRMPRGSMRDNAMSLIGGYDLVLDGSDNFETRYLVSDACFLAAKPLITAALGMFDGSLTTIRAHERNADGEFNPTYRCLFPEPPPPGTVPACAEAGVMGALAGMLGSMMALEAIREIVGFGDGLVGRLLMVDARAMRFETLRYVRDPGKPAQWRHADDYGFERALAGPESEI